MIPPVDLMGLTLENRCAVSLKWSLKLPSAVCVTEQDRAQPQGWTNSIPVLPLTCFGQPGVYSCIRLLLLLDSVADHFYSLWEGIVVPQFPIWQMGSSSTSWATEGFHFMSCKDLENGKYSMKTKGNCIAYCNLSSHCLLPTVSLSDVVSFEY